MQSARVIDLAEYRKQRTDEREAMVTTRAPSPVAMPVYAPVLGSTPLGPVWLWLPVMVVTAG